MAIDTDSTGWDARTRRVLSRIGLNAIGVASGADYQNVLPGCRSVLVFGNGGGALWDAFVADLRAHPAHLADEAHPLDSFVQRAIAHADPRPPASRRWIRCSADEPDPVDFRTLALRAGLGWTSALGLLLHPEYGTWLGLRAACFTTEALPLTPALAGDGPCPSCAAPCASACPATAIRDGVWQVGLCARWNTETDDCVTACAARVACPAGETHRYSALERHYHQDRKTGRRALAASLGIADRGEGIGPHWDLWAGSP